jgi:mono/diheme cytochrome c family protein
MKTWIIRAGVAIILLVCLAAAWFFFWPASLETVTASANQPIGVALVSRGEYLTKAADCGACHTAAGGKPFAGGLAFNLPFGTLYSPNITPDMDTGIGSWSDAQFVRALQHGIGRDGENLYPAFPYDSYALLSTDDVLAIRTYLKTLPPVRTATPANRISFPFDQRHLLRVWNLLFVPNHPFHSIPSKSAAWNQGAYLVNALGHCGECHTPRNLMLGLDNDRKFAGAEQVGWQAYNLTSDSIHGLGGWSDEQLEQYLSTGHANGRGPASGPMAEVIEKSLRFLPAEDIRAIVTYLRDIPAQPDGPPAAQIATPYSPTDGLGQHLFVEACAGCHLPDGSGRQSAWAALRGSHTANDPAGTNLVQVLTHGTQIRTSQGLMFMHPFLSAYTDEELAALANYVNAQFGSGDARVTPDKIRKQRKQEADTDSKKPS